MNIGFSPQEIIPRRRSVRTFDIRPVEESLREQIMAYGAGLTNPLGPPVTVHLVQRETAPGGEKLGTYGVIQGAGFYLGVTVPPGPYSAEALGYSFEQLILYITSLGLGTCWLGGTFSKGAFARAMGIDRSVIFPVISPLGYPADAMRPEEKDFRRSMNSDNRLPWDKLFFRDFFGQPLSRQAAGDYALPLDLMRLAPSTVNKQPWRVVFDGINFHFYEISTMGGGDFDIQRVDLGIGLCHFHLSALEQGLAGTLCREDPGLPTPPNAVYIATWQPQS